MEYNGKKIKIIYADLPASIRGFSSEQREKYMVFINRNMALIRQRYTIGHEVAHIFLNHHKGTMPVAECEREANNNAWTYYKAYKNSLERRNANDS